MATNDMDLSLVKDEDALKRMWQETEDFGRKKEIRSHMYKLREARLREFYNSGEVHADIQRTTKETKSCDSTNHADSLADHSFLSLKSKEIRDSESPTREISYRNTGTSQNQGWNVVSSSEKSQDGKMQSTTHLATISGKQNIEGGQLDYQGKNEHKSSVYQDGDDKNFTKSLGSSSNTFLHQEAVSGDQNTHMKSSSTKSSSSYSTYTEQKSSSVPTGTVTKKVFTTDVPNELKKHPNYIEGKTKVTQETRVLDDGSKVITTKYETTGGQLIKTASNTQSSSTQSSSSKSEVHSSSSSERRTSEQQSISQQRPQKAIHYVEKTHNMPNEMQVDVKVDKKISDASSTVNRRAQTENTICNGANQIHYVEKTHNIPNQSGSIKIDGKLHKDVDQKIEVSRTESRTTQQKTSISDGKSSSTHYVEKVHHVSEPKVQTIQDQQIEMIEQPRHHDQHSRMIDYQERLHQDQHTRKTDHHEQYHHQDQRTRVIDHQDQHRHQDQQSKMIEHHLHQDHQTKMMNHQEQRHHVDQQANLIDHQEQHRQDQQTKTIDHQEHRRQDYQEQHRQDHETKKIEHQEQHHYQDHQTKKIDHQKQLHQKHNQDQKLQVTHHHDQEIHHDHDVSHKDQQNWHLVPTISSPNSSPKTSERPKEYPSQKKTEPIKPHPSELDQKSKPAAGQYDTTYGADYVNRKISVEVSPTHEAFARSLRAVTPDRISKSSSPSRSSFRTSNSSIRSSVSPDKRASPENRHFDRSSSPKKTSCRYPSNETITYSETTRHKRPSKSPEKVEFVTKKRTDTTTLNRGVPIRKSPPKSPERSLITTDLDDDITYKTAQDDRPSSLDISVRKTKKVTERSPTSPLTDTWPRRSPKKETSTPISPTRLFDKQSPVSSVKSLDKPLKRTDTYEERCRQILGLTDTKRERTSSLERVNRKGSFENRTTKITKLSDITQTKSESEIKRPKPQEFTTTTRKSPTKSSNVPAVNQIQEFPSQIRRSPERVTFNEKVVNDVETTETQWKYKSPDHAKKPLEEFPSQIRRSPARDTFNQRTEENTIKTDTFPRRSPSPRKSPIGQEFPSQIRKSTSREVFSSKDDIQVNHSITSLSDLKEFPAQIRKSPLRDNANEETRIRSLKSPEPEMRKSRGPERKSPCSILKEPTSLKQISTESTTDESSAELSLHKTSSKSNLKEFPAQIRKSPEKDTFDYRTTLEKTTSTVKSTSRHSPELQEYPSQLRKSVERSTRTQEDESEESMTAAREITEHTVNTEQSRTGTWTKSKKSPKVDKFPSENLIPIQTTSTKPQGKRITNLTTASKERSVTKDTKQTAQEDITVEETTTSLRRTSNLKEFPSQIRKSPDRATQKIITEETSSGRSTSSRRTPDLQEFPSQIRKSPEKISSVAAQKIITEETTSGRPTSSRKTPNLEEFPSQIRKSPERSSSVGTQKIITGETTSERPTSSRKTPDLQEFPSQIRKSPERTSSVATQKIITGETTSERSTSSRRTSDLQEFPSQIRKSPERISSTVTHQITIDDTSNEQLTSSKTIQDVQEFLSQVRKSPERLPSSDTQKTQKITIDVFSKTSQGKKQDQFLTREKAELEKQKQRIPKSTKPTELPSQIRKSLEKLQEKVVSNSTVKLSELSTQIRRSSERDFDESRVLNRKSPEKIHLREDEESSKQTSIYIEEFPSQVRRSPERALSPKYSISETIKSETSQEFSSRKSPNTGVCKVPKEILAKDGTKKFPLGTRSPKTQESPSQIWKQPQKKTEKPTSTKESKDFQRAPDKAPKIKEFPSQIRKTPIRQPLEKPQDKKTFRKETPKIQEFPSQIRKTTQKMPLEKPSDKKTYKVEISKIQEFPSQVRRTPAKEPTAKYPERKPFKSEAPKIKEFPSQVRKTPEKLPSENYPSRPKSKPSAPTITEFPSQRKTSKPSPTTTKFERPAKIKKSRKSTSSSSSSSSSSDEENRPDEEVQKIISFITYEGRKPVEEAPFVKKFVAPLGDEDEILINEYTKQHTHDLIEKEIDENQVSQVPRSTVKKDSPDRTTKWNEIKDVIRKKSTDDKFKTNVSKDELKESKKSLKEYTVKTMDEKRRLNKMAKETEGTQEYKDKIKTSKVKDEKVTLWDIEKMNDQKEDNRIHVRTHRVDTTIGRKTKTIPNGDVVGAPKLINNKRPGPIKLDTITKAGKATEVRKTVAKPRHVVSTTITVSPKTKPTTAASKGPKSKPKSKVRDTSSDSDEESIPDSLKDVRVKADKVLEKLVKASEDESTKTTETIKTKVRPRLEKKCISTKSIIINNDMNGREIIVDLQRSKSSREPTPDRVCPLPITSDEDSGIPRFPDKIVEPDDGSLLRRKNKKLSDAAIAEDDTAEFTRITDITEGVSKISEVDKVDETDDSLLSVNKKISKFLNTANEVTKKEVKSSTVDRSTLVVDESLKEDDCLLSVSDKVQKFITTAGKLTTPELSERPKSPKCQNYPYPRGDSVEKIDRIQVKENEVSTECVQIESDEDMYSRITKEDITTPKSVRRPSQEEKIILSSAGRLRSTESIKKAKALFENTATRQMDILSRPSVFEGRKLSVDRSHLTPKRLDFSPESEKEPESTKKSREATPEGDLPGYMRPLDRTLRHNSPHKESLSQLEKIGAKPDSVDQVVTDGKPTKFGVVLKRTDSGRNILGTTSHVTESKSKITFGKNITEEDIESIYDLDVLEELLVQVVDYEIRRKIRSQIRLVKKLISENKLTTVCTTKILKTSGESPRKSVDKDLPKQIEYTRKASPERKLFDNKLFSHTDLIEDKDVSKKTTEYQHSYKNPSAPRRSKSPEKAKPKRPSPEKSEKRPFDTKLRQIPPASKVTKTEQPEWVLRKNLKKIDSTSSKKDSVIGTASSKTDSTTTTTSSRKEIRRSPAKDSITSSYGTGPLDEYGSPLFGLKALRAQHKNESSTKIQGTVVRSEFYSENGEEPVGQISVTKYSTDPRDLGDNENAKEKGITSITTTQKFGNQSTKETDERERKESRITTRTTRRNSVKALSQKFIDNAVETSKSERQSSYPKAGLILRTSSFKDSTGSESDRKFSDDSQDGYTKTVTVSTSSSMKSGGQSFLTNKSRVTTVEDAVSRMATEEVRAGDTDEDVEARNLLNKFIGSQVILSGLESQMSFSKPTYTTSSSPSVKRTTVKSTITKGGKPVTVEKTFEHPVTEEELDTVWEEHTLRFLLEQSTDYEERRRIRARLKKVMAEQEACTELVKKASQEQSAASIEGESILPLLQGLLDAPDTEQTADSGTESGEDQRTGLILEVQSALDKLSASLRTDNSEITPERKSSLLQLVTKLQAGLAGCVPASERRHSSSGQSRFNRRRQRSSRHTVGVTKEELADARKLMEELEVSPLPANFAIPKQKSESSISGSPKAKSFICRSPVKNSTPKPYSNSNSVSRSSSSGQTPSEATDYLGYLFGEECNKSSSSLDKILDIMETPSPNKDSEVTDDDTSTYKVSSVQKPDLIMQSNPLYTNPSQESLEEKSRRFNSNKKIKMKRANTIDIPKPLNYYEYDETDYSDCDEDENQQRRNQYFALRGPIRVTTPTNSSRVPPSLVPKTESDKKFLAFINKNKNQAPTPNTTKTSLWFNNNQNKPGADWGNRFDNVKNKFEQSSQNSVRNFWKSADDSITLAKQQHGPKISRQSARNLQKMFEEKQKQNWGIQPQEEGHVVTGSLRLNTKPVERFIPQPLPVNKFSHAPSSAFQPVSQKTFTPIQPIGVNQEAEVVKTELKCNQNGAPETPLFLYSPKTFSSTSSSNTSPVTPSKPWLANSGEHRVLNLAAKKFENASTQNQPLREQPQPYKVRKNVFPQGPSTQEKLSAPYLIKGVDQGGSVRKLSGQYDSIGRSESFKYGQRCPKLEESQYEPKFTVPQNYAISYTQPRAPSYLHSKEEEPKQYVSYQGYPQNRTAQVAQKFQQSQPSVYIPYGKPQNYVNQGHQNYNNQNSQNYNNQNSQNYNNQNNQNYNNQNSQNYVNQAPNYQVQNYRGSAVTKQNHQDQTYMNPAQNYLNQQRRKSQDLGYVNQKNAFQRSKSQDEQTYLNQMSPHLKYQNLVQERNLPSNNQRRKSQDFGVDNHYLNEYPKNSREQEPITRDVNISPSYHAQTKVTTQVFLPPQPEIAYPPKLDTQLSTESLKEYTAINSKVMTGPVIHQASTVKQKSPMSRDEHDMKAAFNLKSALQKASQPSTPSQQRTETVQASPQQGSSSQLRAPPQQIVSNQRASPQEIVFPQQTSVQIPTQPKAPHPSVQDSLHQRAFQPSSAQVKPSQPSSVQVKASQPSSAQVKATQPSYAQARASQPSSAQARSSQPSLTQARASQPSSAHARASQSSSAQARASQSSSAQARASQLSSAQARASQSSVQPSFQQEDPQPSVQASLQQRSSQPSVHGSTQQRASQPLVQISSQQRAGPNAQKLSQEVAQSSNKASQNVAQYGPNKISQHATEKVNQNTSSGVKKSESFSYKSQIPPEPESLNVNVIQEKCISPSKLRGGLSPHNSFKYKMQEAQNHESLEITSKGEAIVTSKFSIPVINTPKGPEPQSKPTQGQILSKSDSWHQICMQQQNLTQKPSPRSSPGSRTIIKSKSSHSLAVPKQFEAGMSKEEMQEKRRTMEAFFSGNKSPDNQKVVKRSINRTKTSEKTSISRQSTGLCRSRTLPDVISAPELLDESNVDQAFEDLFRSS